MSIPTRGSDVDTWDTPVNNDFSALDGYLGGVQIISASNAPITLTSPTGTPTPGAGPTQAQNAILRVTGTLSANVQVTLPLPGPIVIENLTTGNFVLSFRAVASGQVIAIDQGEIQTIYNDGTNVRFVNLGGRIGETSIWAGLTAMPAWVTACTLPPYLLCDGSIHNFSDYPYLGKRLGSAFGGNGITTFGVPSLGGRVALPYDNTGTRITAAGCGLNGQSLGASLDLQAETLSLAQLPTGITVNGNVTVSAAGSSSNQVPYTTGTATTVVLANAGAPIVTSPAISSGSWAYATTFSGTNTLTSNNTNGQAHPNVQPSQVTGIAVIRAA